jgi:putative membrane protein
VPTRRATRGARGPCDCRGGFVSFALHKGKPVKQFGAHRVEDHVRANDELKHLASAKGVSLPTVLDGKNQKVLDRLTKMKSEAFDAASMNDMVADHKEDVAEFKKETRHGKDQEVRSFVAKTLPTLEQHLTMARAAQKK